jgi:hypothetical protein
LNLASTEVLGSVSAPQVDSIHAPNMSADGDLFSLGAEEIYAPFLDVKSKEEIEIVSKKALDITKGSLKADGSLAIESGETHGSKLEIEAENATMTSTGSSDFTEMKAKVGNTLTMVGEYVNASQSENEAKHILRESNALDLTEAYDKTETVQNVTHNSLHMESYKVEAEL